MISVSSSHLLCSVITILQGSLTPIAAGVAVHNIFFIRGEWHILAPTILNVHLSFMLVMLALQLFSTPSNVRRSILAVLTTTAGYSLGLFVSIVIYRIMFHRLREFPGPWPAKWTKLWHVFKIRDGRNHLFLEAMRKQYGDFVRTGPNELTVFHPDIHVLVDGPSSKCTKSAWYDVVHPDKSLVSAREKLIHRERRRLWFNGLGTSSMKEYDRRMLLRVEQLVRLHAKAYENGVPINVSDSFFWFAWDVMGDTTFGRSFGMLENEKWHESLVMLKRALSILGPVTPAPWAFHIAFRYLSGRWVVKDWQKMKETCYKLVDERLEKQNPQEDIFKALIRCATQNGLSISERRFLNGDAVVGLVAGSDPVAATLVFLFSHLARDERLQDRLILELKEHCIEDTNSLRSCNYLTALVNETLRMYPPLMTGGMRDTGPDGLTVGNVLIPANVTIVSPRFSTGRLDNCFRRPNEFLPERWTKGSDLNINERPFNPFGIGAHSCAGKNIVWSEVRLATAALVSKFHIRLAPGETGQEAYEKLKDYVAPAPGPLNLVFEPRL